jgi:hypothetical protein
VAISAPEYHVVTTEYIADYQMVYVFAKDNSVRFQYDGTTLYDISTLGYKLYTHGTDYVLTPTVQVNGTSENCTEKADFTTVYALLLAKGTTYNEQNLAVVSKSTLTDSITLRDAENPYDVDAKTTSDGRVVSVYDETQVMGAYNVRDGYTDTLLRSTFRADTNKDGKVDTNDASEVRAHYDGMNADA